MQVTPETLLGVVTGLSAAGVYAVSVVVYRSQKKEIRPLAISSIKMWVALLFMSLLVVIPFIGEPFAVPSDAVIFLIISVLCGAVLGDTAYLMSQERIGVSYAFPISMSFPIFTYLMTVVFLNETLMPLRFVGVVVAVSGVILIAREQDSSEEEKVAGEGFNVVGILLALSTSILYAIGAVLLQVGVVDVDPINANFVRVLAGSVAFLPAYLIASARGMPRPTGRSTKIVAVAGLFGMGIGSLLYVATVKFAGAAVTSVFGSLAPLFAVPISVIWLKEKLTTTAIIGIAVTLVGVVLVILGG
jgi:drug/metabolite transporter (DMT)-like permease